MGRNSLAVCVQTFSPPAVCGGFPTRTLCAYQDLPLFGCQQPVSRGNLNRGRTRRNFYRPVDYISPHRRGVARCTPCMCCDTTHMICTFGTPRQVNLAMCCIVRAVKWRSQLETSYVSRGKHSRQGCTLPKLLELQPTATAGTSNCPCADHEVYVAIHMYDMQ